VSDPAAIDAAAAAAGLFVSGMAPVLPEDGLPEGRRGVVLLSPDEPRFWEVFAASPERADGRPDPLDRWSRRVIGRIACDLGLKAVFPFGGPPWHPFIGWALRSGRCHVSPVTLLVHDVAGLFISFRGALLLPEAPPAAPSPSPCPTCADQPCRTACPAGALTVSGYDVPACRDWLDRLAPAEGCRTGCLVRRACPVGQSRRRPEQSAFHMAAFHR
jgi:hypothetical protein